jgi:hypothetical protein
MVSIHGLAFQLLARANAVIDETARVHQIHCGRRDGDVAGKESRPREPNGRRFPQQR